MVHALRHSPAVRRLRSAALVCLAALLLAALVTYAPAGSGRGNVLGPSGHAVARALLAAFGFSCFLVFGLLVYWAGLTRFGRTRVHPWLRVAGIVLAGLCLAGLLTLLADPAPWRAGGLNGPGGLAGAGLAGRLTLLAGTAGAVVVTGLGTLLGLALATDGTLLVLARDVAGGGLRLGRRAGALAPRAARGAVRAPGRIAGFFGGEAGPAAEARAAAAPAAPPVVVKEPPAAAPEEAEAPRPEPQADRPEPRPEPAPRPRPAREPRPAAKKPGADRRPTGDRNYEFPPLDLLDPTKARDPRAQEALIEENAAILEETLRDFKVEAEVVDYCRGPVVTLFELDLAAGVKVGRIHALADDLAVALKAPSVRIVAPLPGKSTIGVEVPNPVRDDVRLHGLLTSDAFERNPGFLPLFLGTDVAGFPIIEDLTAMPHLLIAGATGSGKSVCINSILLSLLLTRTPEQVRLILIDPKQVELAFFAKVPHLMTPVVTDMKKSLGVLEWLVDQMEQRYALFHTMEVRNIHSYNELGPKRIRERLGELGIPEDDEPEGIGFPDRLPYIVIVVDELADLMMVAGKEIENLITRLSQKSRAVGLHIVLATQRPSTDVITGLIKANMPCRCSFQVASKIDSRVILDQNGADKLLGRGDMLYLPPRTAHLVRAQGTFVSDGEVKRVVKFLSQRRDQDFEPSLDRAQTGEALAEADKDPLYDEAVRVILDQQRGSASLLQRELEVGYTRGSRLLDQMHKEGIVGPYKGSKAREVLMTLEEYEALVESRRGLA